MCNWSKGNDAWNALKNRREEEKNIKKKKKKGRTRCGIKRMKSDKRRKKSRFEVFFSRRNRVWEW